MRRDYYSVLGVPRDATREEIRKAYRRLAKQLHPDRSGPDSGPFRELCEAFEVLGDPERRAAYDAALSPSEPPRPTRGPRAGWAASPVRPAVPVEPMRAYPRTDVEPLAAHPSTAGRAAYPPPGGQVEWSPSRIVMEVVFGRRFRA